MKINFGLLGLAVAQSGDDRWEDNSYDYDISSDRWSNENQYSLDEANAGITFGVMARVTKQQNAKHFQKALKLSCWNSNMIRDMNNDNKFSVYFNDQVEHKRFHPGIPAGTNGGTVDTRPGADDLSWLYAVGDLRTGYNHQYGFEHNTADTKFSDPLYDLDNTEVNRLGDASKVNPGASTKTNVGRNNNRLRQMDEYGQNEPKVDNAAIAANLVLTKGGTRLVSDSSILVSDQYHSVRPDEKWTFRKWGYQSDNVERAASNGYAEDNVVYHFGHHDNKDNLSNRPNMRYGASNAANLDLESSVATDNDSKNKGNMSKFEFDFHGFKDDWRYSLRMGGCLYEAARWVYDESSFHRTGRLTYTDDTLFMNDPFNPRDGTDIFGAHQYAAHTSIIDTAATAAARSAWSVTDCAINLPSACSVAVDTYITKLKALSEYIYNPAYHNSVTKTGCFADAINVTPSTDADKLAAALVAGNNCFNGASSSPAKTIGEPRYNEFVAARDALANIPVGIDPPTSGCLRAAAVSQCTDATIEYSTATPFDWLNLLNGGNTQLQTYARAVITEANRSSEQSSNYADEFTIYGHTSDLFTDNNGGTSGTQWNNAGSTDNEINYNVSGNEATGTYSHGNCVGGDSSCENMNVATPSSGGVFADVHWVHVFNAHIFPLQDVGYYQYDQTMGIENINQDNDSITSRDGYGYNIYTSNVTGNLHVMRDVWGEENVTSYIDTSNNYSYNQGLSTTLATAKNTYNTTAYGTTWMTDACAIGAADAAARTCQGRVLELAEAYKEFHRCALVNAAVCDLGSTSACHTSTAHPCYWDKDRLTTAAALVWSHDDSAVYSGCLSAAAPTGIATGCAEGSGEFKDSIAEDVVIFKAKFSGGVEHPSEVSALLTSARTVAAAQAALDLRIPAHQFHSQYGTLNIGNLDGHNPYGTDDRPTTSSDDFYPILTKTRRKIEDFNVVMANPTYEGHGFLNFVATYHDHTENFDDSDNSWIRQVGKRFLSTIGGLTTASNDQRNVCRAVKDGIDSYRLNGLIPAREGNGAGTGGYAGDIAGNTGHDDPFLGPLGPGPAGNYGNGQRCGAAMYENFGDWFLRPAQTYAAYNKFTENFSGTNGALSDGSTGWGTSTGACTPNTGGDLFGDYCLTDLESYNYWAFILSEDYNPIKGDGDAEAWTYQSAHELWRNGSMYYDRRGEAGASRKRRQAPVNTGVGVPRSSGRGFAISSFPANELGKDFRFNIRTLHNMGNGVAKQFYQIQNLRGHDGNTSANDPSLKTSNLRSSETVWSYYFYAVDTIKIAFPEFVARVNHCDNHLHRGDSHCLDQFAMPVDNGGPDGADAASDPNGLNNLSAYPGYAQDYPYNRLGFQEIIIDGVTMKKTDNQYDSRVTNASRTTDPNGAGNWHKQYHNSRGLREDDHTRATLLYADTEFANEDLSLHESNTAMCSDNLLTLNMGTEIKFFGGDGSTRRDAAGESSEFHGYADSYQPLKPCASWCALDEFANDVVTGFGVDNSKQTLDGFKFGDGDGDRLASVFNPTDKKFSKYGGICGRVLRIDGLLQTYDELHNRQYGTIQEIWVQLQYAYQESLDTSDRTTTASSINKVQSPFPNVFFSAPEVVDIRGFCPSSNMKCRGYMSDQHQPYGGSRSHVERVHWNNSGTRSNDQANGFGANQLNTGVRGSGLGPKQSGNDWTLDRDFRGDTKWPWNYHSYSASGGESYGLGATGTQYTARDENHVQYS